MPDNQDKPNKGAKRAAKWVAKYIRFTRANSKFTLEPSDMDHYFRTHNPFILGVWHGQFMLIPTIRPDDIKGTIVVGVHNDANLAAEVVSLFGVRPIRGSGASGRRAGKDRGGAKVLREAIKALKNNECIVSTVDVPPGPAQRAGLGIITMARLSGRPIIPAAIATKNAITLQSWSRLTINLPFAKGALVAGEPLHVPKNAGDEELEAKRLELEAAMDRVTKRAYQIVGKSPAKIAPMWQRSLTPGLALKTYRLTTNLLKPAAPLILRYRQKRGKEIEERFNERTGKASLPRPAGKLWWFHAASVGETNAILPLIRSLLANNPELTILLTTGTVTSTKLVATRLPDRAIHQLIPLDNPAFMQSFLTHWHPDLAALTESEIWPNLILETKAKGIPLFLINGRMSKRSFKRWFKKPGMARPLFGRFDHVLAQSQVDANHFIALGAEPVTNTGNLKADAPPLTFDPQTLEKLQTATRHRKIFLAASTHNGEEEIILKGHQLAAKKHPDLLTIIVPRHPERTGEIIETLKPSGLTITTRTETDTPQPGTDIYIANTIGELGLFYSLADIAFIGGSLVPHGGQNPIEAVNLGSMIMTGRYVGNFRSFYHELFVRGAALRVKGSEDMAAKIIDYFNDPSQHKAMQQGAKDALNFLKGAQSQTEAILLSHLKNSDRH